MHVQRIVSRSDKPMAVEQLQQSEISLWSQWLLAQMQMERDGKAARDHRMFEGWQTAS